MQVESFAECSKGGGRGGGGGGGGGRTWFQMTGALIVWVWVCIIIFFNCVGFL